MGKKLAANVYVGGDLFLAGDTPSKEIAEQITNPRAWGDEPSDPAPSQPEEPAKAAPAKKAAAKKAAAPVK